MPVLIGLAILAAGAAYYHSSARYTNSAVPIDLPDGLTAEHPGPMNWYQEIDGVYHHWIVQPDGTFEYVGVMKNDSEPEIRAATTQKSMAEQRRRALMNAMKR